MTVDRLKPPIVRTLKSDLLYRLDTSGKTEEERLVVIEDIRAVLRQRITEKSGGKDKKRGSLLDLS